MESIVYLILLIVIALIVIVINTLSRTLLDKKNLVFFLPVLIILFFIYVTGYHEVVGKLSGLNYFKCITAAFDSFSFKVANDIVSPLMEKDPIYAADVYFSVTFAGLTVISGILGFFKIGIDNFFSVLFKSLNKELDIVVGDPALGVEYAKKNKHSILWVDPRVNRLSNEEKKKYFSSRVSYVNLPLTGSRVKRFTWMHRGFIQIVCLQKDNKYLSDILSLIESLNGKRKYPFRLFVQTNDNLLSFVDDKLGEECSKVNGVTASSFDVYELISRKFAYDYNLAEFLPRSFYKDGTIVKGKNINVVMLGFGKTSRAVFKGLLLNNQFVELVDGKYCAKKINCYLYDVNPKCFQDSLINYLQHNDIFEMNNDVETCELPCEVHCGTLDVKTNIDEDYLKKFRPSEDDFTFFFVSLKDGLENALFAESLTKTINSERSMIFYNVDSDKENIASKSKNIAPFGFKQSVLNHNYICNEELWELANEHNKNYANYKGSDSTEYVRRSIIEKMSNAYSVINYRFKLNVLGFDMVKESDNPVGEEEFMKEYDPDNKRSEDKYENYFSISPRNAIAYQEHLRWSVLYLLNGFSPLPLNEVKYESGRLVHKDVFSKKHACLVPYYELDKLVKLEESLLPKGEDKSKADTYRYDFQSLDKLFSTIEVAGYKIVRK